MKYSKFRTNLIVTFFLLSFLSSLEVLANEGINKFIEQVSAPTYDCPNPKLIPQLLDYLESEDLDEEQRFRLSIEKAQNNVCIGKTAEADEILKEIVASPNMDKSSAYYADAIYILGFIQDLYSSNERCTLYDQAINLSEGKFHDVNVSANLGYLTECENFSFQQKLSKIYSLLDDNTAENDVGLLAHIYNSLGLVYNKHSLDGLAAEQYIKAHYLAADVYNGSNRLSLLTSAISALISANKLERAQALIFEYDEINKEVNTAYTNFVYLILKSRLYHRQGNYEALRETIEKWRLIDPMITNNLWNTYFRWYEGVLCLHDKNRECIEKLFSDPKIKDSIEQISKTRSIEWTTFRIRAQFFLGNTEEAQNAVEHFFRITRSTRTKYTKLNNSLNVAELYSKIEDLESTIKLEKDAARYFSYLFVILILTIPFAIYTVFKQRNKKQQETDPITGLFSPEAIMDKIAKFPAPKDSKVHALAVFDLANFRELNRMIGASKGDLILKEVAQTLTTVTRPQDILGRLSPEQFLVCLTNIEETTAKSFLERVRKALERTFLGGQHGIDANLQSSMSIFITSDKFDDVKTILDDMLVSLTVKSPDISIKNHV